MIGWLLVAWALVDAVFVALAGLVGWRRWQTERRIQRRLRELRDELVQNAGDYERPPR